MQSETYPGCVKILAIGDVIGRAGRNALTQALVRARARYAPDIVLCNGENAAGGFGLTKKIYTQFTEELKIDCVTMGNHWHDKPEIHSFAPEAARLVLPANMANIADENVGLKVLQNAAGQKFAVINLIGKAFMHDGNRSPFDAVSRLMQHIPPDVRIRIVDMHAEATSEKQGIGHFLAGRVSLVYGTHSHVPTADDRIFENHTGYITDLGMTGAYDSIIGMRKELALKRMLSEKKEKLEPAEGDPWFCAILAKVDPESGRCQHIERLQWRLNHVDLSQN